MKNLRERVSGYLKAHEKHVSSAALALGFIFDTLTLRRADLLIENLFLLTYVVLVGVCIVRLNIKPRPWNLILMQFCLGNLFSAFLIFYSRSASIVASWPFLLLLLLLMIVNERLRERYARLAFQITVYFSVMFSYAIFLVPILIKKIGPPIFILSGVISLFFLSAFIWVLRRFAPKALHGSRQEILAGVMGVAILLNVFYFTNIIPPIPLSLKEIGVYSSVARNPDGSYVLKEGPKLVSKPLYVYSSVFAPTELDVKIVHVWQYFDESKARWTTSSRIPFQIYGGRDGGFRGYSEKSNLFAGRWRVNVETEDGKLIGRTKFIIPKNK